MMTARNLMAKWILCMTLQGVIVSPMSLGLDRKRQFIQQSIESTVSNAYDPFIRPYQQLKADNPTNEKPSTETSPIEKPSTEPTPKENPSTESAPNEKPSSETSPNQKPSSETLPNENPPSETAPNEKPSSQTTPNEKPSNQTTANEKPSSETTTDEKPSSETKPKEKLSNGTAPNEKPSNATAPKEKLSSGASPNEKPSNGTAPNEIPSSETAPNEKPSSETAPNEKPSNGTAPNEKPSNGTAPNEKPSNGTAPNEKPSNGTATNEKPSSETTPSAKPNSEGGKDKMGSFKIDDGDVIGGGIYEIKPDGMVAMDIKLKISPGASSPALCPAPPCPSEAPKAKSTKAAINIENPPTTVTPAPIAVTASGKIPAETLYSKPESSSKDEPVSSQVNVEWLNEHNTAKTFEAAEQDGKGGASKTTLMTIKEQEASTLPSKESLTPITKDEEKTKATSGWFGKTRKALGSSDETVANLFSNAAQARLKAIKQNLRLGNKNLPELNKLQAALSDAATAWAFNYRNADLARRRDYMARPRHIYYTHQNYVPMQ